MKKIRYDPKFNSILYIVLLTTIVFIIYMVLSKDDHFSPIESILSQTNERPSVYRVLPALITYGLSFLTGLNLFACAILVMYFSLLGFFLVYSKLLNIFLSEYNYYLCMAISAIGILPFLFRNRYIYDFPILFIFTLAIYLMAHNKIGRFLVLFIFAALTKETSIVLVFLFAIHFRKLQKQKYFFYLLLQLLIYGMIRFGVMYIFRNNPGSIVQYHLWDHVDAYIKNPLGGIILLACMIGIFFIGLTNKRDDHKILNEALLTVGCPILVLYFIFGYPFEIRVFLEIFPVMALLVSSRIFQLTKKSPHPTPI